MYETGHTRATSDKILEEMQSTFKKNGQKEGQNICGLVVGSIPNDFSFREPAACKQNNMLTFLLV